MINLTDEELAELLGEPEVMIPMKCKRCDYEEEVPEWILEEFLGEEIYSGKENQGYSCQCPKCNGRMVRKK